MLNTIKYYGLKKWCKSTTFTQIKKQFLIFVILAEKQANRLTFGRFQKSNRNHYFKEQIQKIGSEEGNEIRNL